MTTAPREPAEHPALTSDLLALGLRCEDQEGERQSRKGGAGPTDHKAFVLDGRTVMVPIHTGPAAHSPFRLGAEGADGARLLERDGKAVGLLRLPGRPRLYDLKTADGIPYSHIAVLHGSDVLASTVLQSCIRYNDRRTSCQFCAIGQSLAEGATILRKTPEQLAEVARAAVALDGVRHMVLTTGTPNNTDRGAAILCESAEAIRRAVPLPLQAQCEPPDDFVWFGRMKAAGIDSLGMHLEAVTPDVRARIMPGKAKVPLNRYFAAFEAAVPVFGRGQVNTYILAGLGDSRAAILDMAERLAALGVFPFVVPFVPVSGTPLQDHPPPDPAFLGDLSAAVAAILKAHGLRSADIKAGCGRCGACSALPSFEG